MPFLEHIKELRRCLLISFYALIVATIFAYIFYHEIVSYLTGPFQNLDNTIKLENSSLFLNSLLEGFFIKVKISLISGVIFSFPIHLYNIVSFILPALQPREKKVIFFFIVFSFALVIFSVFFSYQKIIPLSISFLTSVGFIPQDVGVLLSYQNNVLFVLQFLIASLVLFQLPVIINILLLFDFIKLKTLIKQSRNIVIAICILSAVITPPDPISLISFAIPLIVLFYLSLFIAKIANWGK